MHSKIILFDGVCNFCNFWVKFAGKRDKKKLLKFASLQSDIGQALLKKYAISVTDLSTVVFIDEDNVFLQSSAAFTICKYLNGGWKLVYALMIIPKPFRDALYNIIAKNRYAWFGKTDECMLPIEDLKERFL